MEVILAILQLGRFAFFVLQVVFLCYGILAFRKYLSLSKQTPTPAQHTEAAQVTVAVQRTETPKEEPPKAETPEED